LWHALLGLAECCLLVVKTHASFGFRCLRILCLYFDIFAGFYLSPETLLVNVALNLSGGSDCASADRTPWVIIGALEQSSTAGEVLADCYLVH